MKKFFKQYCIVALMFFNATIVFSQSSQSVDSLINIVSDKIKTDDYIIAEEILDSLRTIPLYKIDSVRLRIDFLNAVLLKKQKKDEQALKILLNGLYDCLDKKGYANLAADYAYEIGGQFSGTKNYPKAFHYFRLVRKMAAIEKDSLNISKGHLGVGSVHLRMYQEFHRGVVKMDTTSLISHGDSAVYHYFRAIQSFPKSKKDKEYLAIVYTNLIAYNFYEEDYNAAEEFAELSLEIRREANDSVHMASAINMLGAINLRKLDFKSAEKYYLLGLNLVRNKRNFESIHMKQSFLRNLSQVYGELGFYKKAYEYRQLAHLLSDSIHKASSDIKFSEYEAKYNVSEEEKRTEIEKGKRQKAELWIYVLGISSGIVMLFLWIIYRSNRYRREKQLLEFQQARLLQERKMEIVQNEAQIKILNATLDGKETERRHIAEILHNSVSALLSSAGLHLQAAKIELKEKAPEEIEKSQAIVSEASEKIRDLSHQLVSSVLLKFGLSYAMDDLCDKYSNSKLSFESDSIDVQRYTREFEIKIHSIIEELINNIIKHSNAENANILIKQYDGKLQFRIFDNGTGFDVEKMRKNNSGGLGLTQIEARIKMMKGVFDIKSSKKTGTRVYINVPIPESN